eukprot:2328630-Rhodomonas_salina.1
MEAVMSMESKMRVEQLEKVLRRSREACQRLASFLEHRTSLDHSLLRILASRVRDIDSDIKEGSMGVIVEGKKDVAVKAGERGVDEANGESISGHIDMLSEALESALCSVEEVTNRISDALQDSHAKTKELEGKLSRSEAQCASAEKKAEETSKTALEELSKTLDVTTVQLQTELEVAHRTVTDLEIHLADSIARSCELEDLLHTTCQRTVQRILKSQIAAAFDCFVEAVGRRRERREAAQQ